MGADSRISRWLAPRSDHGTGPSFAGTAVALSVLAGFSLALHAPSFVVADSDAYYHLRHAWVYLDRGLGYAEFPWMQASVIRTEGADLWYGFHVLLLPFAAFTDLVLGLRVAAVGVTFTALVIVYWALRRLDAAAPLAWTLVLGVISPDLAFRLTMLRPHTLSLALTIAIFAALAPRGGSRGGSNEGEGRPAAGLLSFLLAWMHLSLAWTAIVVLAGTATVGWVLARRLPSFKTALAVLGGLAFGALARPAPLGGLRLAWIQLLGRKGPQGGSVEMLPLPLEIYLQQLVPLTALLVLALAVAVTAPRRTTRAAVDDGAVARWASLGLALGFLALAFVAARRASELFVGFAVTFVALAATPELRRRAAPGSLRRPAASSSPRRRAGVGIAGALALAVVSLAVARGLPLVRHYQRLVGDWFAPERFRDASAWLAANSEEGAVVFHVDWERFAHLFFWNPKNRYIHGMDPRFEFAYDPYLSRAHRILTTGDIFAFASEFDRREHGIAKPLRRTLVEDFGASYIVLEKRISPLLTELFRNVYTWTPVFETDGEVVFHLPARSAGTPPPASDTSPPASDSQ